MRQLLALAMISLSLCPIIIVYCWFQHTVYHWLDKLDNSCLVVTFQSSYCVTQWQWARMHELASCSPANNMTVHVSYLKLTAVSSNCLTLIMIGQVWRLVAFWSFSQAVNAQMLDMSFIVYSAFVVVNWQDCVWMHSMYTHTRTNACIERDLVRVCVCLLTTPNIRQLFRAELGSLSKSWYISETAMGSMILALSSVVAIVSVHVAMGAAAKFEAIEEWHLWKTEHGRQYSSINVRRCMEISAR